jgi:hypothetical protein
MTGRPVCPFVIMVMPMFVHHFYLPGLLYIRLSSLYKLEYSGSKVHNLFYFQSAARDILNGTTVNVQPNNTYDWQPSSWHARAFFH